MANQDVLLINRDDIMKTTGTGGNVDTDKFYPHIKTAQDIYIQNVLGTKLYEKLLTIVGDGTWENASNVDYAFLIERYVTPVLVYYTMVEFMPFQLYQLQNAGIYRTQTDNSITAEENEMQMLSQRFKDKAEFYLSRLEDYLCNNSSKFPEYGTNTGSDMSPDNDASTFNGWNI